MQLLEAARISLAKTNYEQALEAYFKADALLPPANFLERMDSQMVISKTYLAKGSPEQAEQHARKALAIWQSSGATKLDRLYEAYSLLVQAAAAQGRDADVVKAARSVAQSPKAELAQFDGLVVGILRAGYRSAAALKDTNTSVTFLKLSVELCNLAIKQNPDAVELNKARVQTKLAVQCVLGYALGASGNYEEAIEVLRDAEREATQAGDERVRKELYAALGHAQVMGGQPMDAIRTLTNVVGQLDDTSGTKMLVLTDLQLGYILMGEPAKAHEASAKMLQLAITAGRPDGALSSLRMQAIALLGDDRLVEARDSLENALRALANYPDQFHTDRYETFGLLAKVNCRLWDFENARRALDGAWNALPRATRNVSPIESNLTFAAYCSVASQFNAEAQQSEAQIEWALRGHSITLQYDTDVPMRVQSYLNVARAYVRVRDFRKAFEHLESAKTEAGKFSDSNSGLELDILEVFALAHSEQGDLGNAIRVREQLLDLVERKSGKTGGFFLRTLMQLAIDHFKRGEFQKSSELCVETQFLFTQHVWRDLAFLPTGNDTAWSLWGVVTPQIACLAALATTDRVTASNAALVSAMSKGLASEMWSAQAILSRTQSVAAVRKSIAEFWASPPGKTPSGHASKAYGLRGEISMALQAILETSRVSIGEIRNSIPTGAVLVDFINYRRYDFAAQTDQWKEQRYAAYLAFPLARDSTNVVVERVDLGEVAPINEAVELVCKRMSAGQFAAKDLSPALQRLSQLVYAPLTPFLTNVSHLIVCPDGQLSRLPFEMLSQNGRYLIEDKTISYVTSGREVVRIAKPLSRPAASLSSRIGAPISDPARWELEATRVGDRRSFRRTGPSANRW